MYQGRLAMNTISLSNEDYFNVQMGKVALPTKEEAYWNGNTPFVSPIDFGGLIGSVEKTYRLLSNEGLRKSKAYIFPPGTILISREFHQFPQVYVLKIDAAVSFHLYCIQIKTPKQLMSEYVALMLYSIREQLELFSVGGVRRFLKRDLLRSISIPHISLEEQKTLVEDKFPL